MILRRLSVLASTARPGLFPGADAGCRFPGSSHGLGAKDRLGGESEGHGECQGTARVRSKALSELGRGNFGRELELDVQDGALGAGEIGIKGPMMDVQTTEGFDGLPTRRGRKGAPLARNWCVEALQCGIRYCDRESENGTHQ